MNEGPIVLAPVSVEEELLFECARKTQLLAGAMAGQAPAIGWLGNAWEVLGSLPKPVDQSHQRIVAQIVTDLARRFRGYPVGEFRRIGALPCSTQALRCVDGLALIRCSCHESRFCLDHAARVIGVSRWYLSRLLVSESGYGFAEHVRNMRLLSAVCLVHEPSLSLKEIAAGVGVASTSELDRMFKRTLAFPPTRIRVLLHDDSNGRTTTTAR